jgi:hypothetical protein
MDDKEIDQLFLDENELQNLQFQEEQKINTIKEDENFFYNLFNSPVDMLSHTF